MRRCESLLPILALKPNESLTLPIAGDGQRFARRVRSFICDHGRSYWWTVRRNGSRVIVTNLEKRIIGARRTQ